MATKTTSIFESLEGSTNYNRTYIEAQATEIILDRKFTIAGYTYTLKMTSTNMHDVLAENMVMKWSILCANPVVPADWFLDYPPHHYEG